MNNISASTPQNRWSQAFSQVTVVIKITAIFLLVIFCIPLSAAITFASQQNLNVIGLRNWTREGGRSDLALVQSNKLLELHINNENGWVISSASSREQAEDIIERQAIREGNASSYHPLQETSICYPFKEIRRNVAVCVFKSSIFKPAVMDLYSATSQKMYVGKLTVFDNTAKEILNNLFYQSIQHRLRSDCIFVKVVRAEFIGQNYEIEYTTFPRRLTHKAIPDDPFGRCAGAEGSVKKILFSVKEDGSIYCSREQLATLDFDAEAID